MIQKHLIPTTNLKEPIEFADKQLEVFWLHGEIKVEKDIQDILVNCTEAEKHGIITTLKLFTLYETHAGSEYWGSRFRQIFRAPEFERMASVFSMFELAVHAPFYKKINELLYLDNEEFYTDYVNDPALLERMDFIDKAINDNDPLVSVGTFSMVEGAILYSNFAYLKHFQSQGKNKATNIVRGINFSVRDENLHSEGGAWSFKYLAKERGCDKHDMEWYERKMKHTASIIYDHECKVIDKLFEKGPIDGITALQLKNFVQSRLNVCLNQMGFTKMYDVKYNPIGEWFYKGINNYQFNDFFSGQGREYNRGWDEEEFVWKKEST